MPFVFIALALALIIVGVRGTQTAAIALLRGEVAAFVPWLVAIFVLGSLGYFNRLRPFTNAFLGLILLVMFLSNGGFFAKLNAQLRNPATVNPPAAGSIDPLNPASSVLQTAPSSILPGVQNPFLPLPGQPIGPNNVPATGGGFGQF